MPIWKEKCFVPVGLFQAFFWQGRIPGPTPAPAQPQQPTDDRVTKSLQSWLDLGLKSALELGRDTPNAVRGLSN